ncbi:MAG: hypothetical protein ABI224_12355, partial [Acetobacteraceae bacterium]
VGARLQTAGRRAESDDSHLGVGGRSARHRRPRTVAPPGGFNTEFCLEWHLLRHPWRLLRATFDVVT